MKEGSVGLYVEMKVAEVARCETPQKKPYSRVVKRP